MKFKRYEEPFPAGDPRTTTTTTLTGERDYLYRALTRVEVCAPLTRAEIESLIALVVADLVDGNAKFGGPRYDDLCLAYAIARTKPPAGGVL